MRRIVTGLMLAALAALTAVPARVAGASGGEASVRIGYVDFTKAINEVADGVAAKKRLQAEFREKQQRLDALQSELASQKDRIDRDRLVLSSDALESREKAYRQKFSEVQQRFADFQREMTQREARITEEILAKLRGIVRGIGEQEGYALILEKSQDLVLYAPTGEDLTARVIAEYNRGAGKKGK
jgi:outer membrane protein